jgi:hypothetical protein
LPSSDLTTSSHDSELCEELASTSSHDSELCEEGRGERDDETVLLFSLFHVAVSIRLASSPRSVDVRRVVVISSTWSYCKT